MGYLLATNPILIELAGTSSSCMSQDISTRILGGNRREVAWLHHTLAISPRGLGLSLLGQSLEVEGAVFGQRATTEDSRGLVNSLL